MKRLVLGLLLLLAAGCSPSFLQHAARDGRIQDVRRELAKGADPNKGGGGPMDKCARPLSCAVMNGHLDAVIALLEAGADPKQTGGKFPPLRYALSQKDPAFTELLLDFGADPGQRGHVLWETQLSIARQFRKDLLPMLEEAAAGKLTPRYIKATGIVFDQFDDRIIVRDVLRGTPAHAAGVQRGDRILRADGRSLDGMAIADIKSLLQKPAGSVVTYTLAAANGPQRDVSLRRVIITPAMRDTHAALEARAERVRAAEQAGDAEASAGRPGAALSRYGDALRAAEWSELDWAVREKAIRLALTMSPPPEIPETARERAAKAMAYIKMSQSNDDFAKALNELAAVLLMAPWWADVYSNYSLLQEKLHGYDAAVWALRTYLLAAPNASDAVAVKNKILELQIAKEHKEQQRWQNNR